MLQKMYGQSIRSNHNVLEALAAVWSVALSPISEKQNVPVRIRFRRNRRTSRSVGCKPKDVNDEYDHTGRPQVHMIVR
jgi:hypothetical protein